MLSLYLSLSGGFLFSQGAERPGRTTDSLKSLLEHAASDSVRSDYLSRKGEILENVQKDYPGAISNYRMALAYDVNCKLYAKSLGDYTRILNLYFYIGNYPEAMKMTTRELVLAEDHHDTFHIAKCYNLMGFIYSRQGNTAEAGKYFSLYAGLSKKLKDKRMMADAFNNIGETRAANRKYEEALFYLYKAYELYDHLTDSERLAYTSYKISEVYKGMKSYDLALDYSVQALQYIRTGRGNQYDRAGYFINAGDVYKGLARYGDAVRMTWQGLGIAQSIRHREDILEAWYTLAGIYALQHRYDSAYYYYTRYAALKDSISNDQSRKEIEEIHEQYALDKKDREIVFQKAQLVRESLLKNILIGSSLFLIVLILLLYNRRRLKQRASYEARLNQQRSELFGAIIMAQDNERKRIAQDIHDTLGSILSAAKLNLSTLDDDKAPFRDSQQRKYLASLKLLDEASAELRNIAHNIMPAGLSRIGLPAVVKGLLDNISPGSGLTVNYNVHGFEDRLPESVEISIYLILSELINNVIKHSGASVLTVQMIRYPRYINIMVEDNGCGLDGHQEAGQWRGMGLNNIRYRVNYLKGMMDIDSRKGAGTTVMIEVPINRVS